MHTYVSHVLFMFGLLCNYALRADFLASRFFKIGYNNTAAGIAGDIDNCTSHIKDSVDTCNQGNTVNRQTNGSQDHGQHDHTCTGDTGSTDGSQCGCQNNGEHLGRRQCDAVTGSDEDRTDTLINGCTVHVDGRTQRQNKEEISLEAPSPSTHSRLIGSVPTEEELEKANIIAGSMPLKNFSGLNPPMALTAREYITTTWIT